MEPQPMFDKFPFSRQVEVALLAQNRALQGLDESVPEEDISVQDSPLKAIDADEKNMDLQHPKYKELCPKWNLALVLAYITSPPFKPIMKASLWHLTLKTVFLGQEPETSRLYTSDSYPSVRAYGGRPP